MGRRKGPRKWSNLKDQLPAAPVNESGEWIEKVFREKDARQQLTMEQLSDEWAALVEEEDKAREAESERNIKFAALERRILEELEKVQEVSGQDVWRGKGRTFSPKIEPYPVVTDRAKLKAWIKEEGLDDLLTLPPATLKTLTKEAFDTEIAAMMSPAQRAKLKPGKAGSGQAPPGVTPFLKTTVNARVRASKRAQDDGDDD